MARDRAEEALWAGLRLAVIDTETTWDKAHGTKVVSIGLVTCRAGRLQGRWSSLVNPGPGIHISSKSTRIHGLRDEDVEGAPTFADLVGTLLPALTPQPGETLVVVAHHAAYDIPLVRDEFTAAGHALPDLPVLDTMGQLPALAGVKPPSRGLADLIAELGIVNPNPHDALADAVATAEAAVELLGRAAEAGHMDITRLLADVEATTTLTQTAAKGGSGGDDTPSAPTLTEEHLASHATILGAAPAARTLTRWANALRECGRLRCSHAAARVSAAKAPADTLLPAITDAITDLASEGDAAGVATLLTAAAPVLEATGAGMPIRLRRAHSLSVYDRWAHLTDGLARCTGDRCPACRDGEPCGLDTWTYHLAGAAVGTWEKGRVISFFPISGKRVRAGDSVWGTWTLAGRGPIADAALWRCYEWWTDNDHEGSAAMLAQLSWQAGARHPRLTDAYIASVAAGGRPADLQTALDVADTTLLTDPQPGPPEHWRALQARRTWLAGQLARGSSRFSGQLDEDGNPILVRRHHPDTPRRTRPARFLRQATPHARVRGSEVAPSDSPDTVDSTKGATVAPATPASTDKGEA